MTTAGVDPIDQSQQLLLKSFEALTTTFKDLEGELGVFKELEECLRCLPEYEVSLEEKITELNTLLSSSIPNELEELRTQLDELRAKKEKYRERYELVTDDFLLKE